MYVHYNKKEGRYQFIQFVLCVCYAINKHIFLPEFSKSFFFCKASTSVVVPFELEENTPPLILKTVYVMK